MTDAEGTGLFRVTVHRADGDVHSGREHTLEARAGSWVSALREAAGNTNEFAYTVVQPGTDN